MQTIIIILAILAALIVFLFGLWLFLAAPGGGRKRARAFARVCYAHRGLHNAERAENSLSAFRAAAGAGFGIELDVRLSADGEVVVIHDPDLKRVAGVDRRVRDMTAAELAAVSLSGTGEGVPLFRDVLSVVAGRVPILVEIKEDTAADRDVTPAALAVLRDYDGAYFIEGFNPFSIARTRKDAPETVRGMLSDHFTLRKETDTPMFRALQLFLTNVIARPQFIAYNGLARRYLPFRLLRGLFRVPTFAWTIRTPEEEKICRKAGFDSVIFENYVPDHGRVTDEQ